MNKIMAHMVAFYPDREKSLEVARALIDGGCSYLEVQFPFTDPSADGVYIQRACKTALDAGFKVSKGFQLISKINEYANRVSNSRSSNSRRSESHSSNSRSSNRAPHEPGKLLPSHPPVFIMTYANLIFFRGIERFLEECKDAGVSGVIVPDLPPDSDEGLYSLGRKKGIKVIPVIMPNITDDRFDLVINNTEEYLYAAIRTGITGKFTRIDSSVLDFLERVNRAGAKVLAGFGISKKSQVEAVAPLVHSVVVGSAFIRVMEDAMEKIGKQTCLYQAVLEKIRELV